MTIKGLITAMVTPIGNDSIDEEAVHGLVKCLIQKEVNGIFILGANGEFHILSKEEKIELTAMAVEYVDYRAPVYAGSGDNSTQGVIELSQALQQTGITTLSVITPFLVPLSQQELLQYYEAVADTVNIPVVLYNIPKNTGDNIESQAAVTLACRDNIVEIKGSSGDIERVKRYIELTRKVEFVVLSRSDSLILRALKLGAKETVAVVNSLLTDTDVAIIRYLEQEKLTEAQTVQGKIEPLRKVLKLGGIPSVLKVTMNMARIAAGECRKPIIMPNEAVLAEIREMLQYYVQEGET